MKLKMILKVGFVPFLRLFMLSRKVAPIEKEDLFPENISKE
jgi:hypothetical protein